jgi:hypothetical protein
MRRAEVTAVIYPMLSATLMELYLQRLLCLVGISTDQLAIETDAFRCFPQYAKILFNS